VYKSQEYMERYQLSLYRCPEKLRLQVMEWLRGPLSEWATKQGTGQEICKPVSLYWVYNVFWQTLYLIVVASEETTSLFWRKMNTLFFYGQLFPEWIKITGIRVQKHWCYKSKLFSSENENKRKARCFWVKLF